MHSSIRLGRIAGIPIGVNWTWLVVFVLVVFSLAGGVFPDQNPGLSDTTYVVMGIVAALLFFGSVILHELGHALEARREGLEIDGITLWLFGGVARFRGGFPSARTEFRVGAAGPLVSLVLGVALIATAALVPLPAPVDGVIAWLGYINILVLVFNLLPALPLDGGRLLRSALWARMDDFGRATQVAAGFSRFFAYLMIGGGVLLFLGAGFGGLWLALIGFFLLAAAEGESQAATARDALQGLCVRDAAALDPVTVTPGEPLDRFIEDVVFRHRHTAYPVVDDGRPAGIVSFRAAAAVPRERWREQRVADVMTPLERTLVFDGGTPLADALPTLAGDDLRRGLVITGDRLDGLLSITDAARLLELRRPPAAPAGPMRPAGPAAERPAR